VILRRTDTLHSASGTLMGLAHPSRARSRQRTVGADILVDLSERARLSGTGRGGFTEASPFVLGEDLLSRYHFRCDLGHASPRSKCPLSAIPSERPVPG